MLKIYTGNHVRALNQHLDSLPECGDIADGLPDGHAAPGHTVHYSTAPWILTGYSRNSNTILTQQSNRCSYFNSIQSNFVL